MTPAGGGNQRRDQAERGVSRDCDRARPPPDPPSPEYRVRFTFLLPDTILVSPGPHDFNSAVLPATWSGFAVARRDTASRWRGSFSRWSRGTALLPAHETIIRGDDERTSLLRNRFYIGEVVFRGQICPGEHPPILDRGLFEAVQQRLAEQHHGYHATAAGSEALLMGRIFDDRSNRMSPSHSRKGGARYGYDVSSALIQGQPQSAGSVARVPAAKIEAVALDAVRRHIGPDAPADNTELITTYVRQIEVRRTEIAISLMSGDHASDRRRLPDTWLRSDWRACVRRRERPRHWAHS